MVPSSRNVRWVQAALGPHFAMGLRGSPGGKAEVSRVNLTSLGPQSLNKVETRLVCDGSRTWDLACGTIFHLHSLSMAALLYVPEGRICCGLALTTYPSPHLSLMFFSSLAFTGIPEARYIPYAGSAHSGRGEAPSSSGMAEARGRRSPERYKTQSRGQRELEEGISKP